MCIHPTKSGTKCRKNPELFLCGTHLLHVDLHKVNDMNIVDLFARKFDSSKAKAIFAPGVVDWWSVIDSTPNSSIDSPHRPGYLYNGSDFMGELMVIAGTTEYVVKGHDGQIVSVRDLVTTPAITTPRITCGTCRKNGVADPTHPTSADVRECYKARYAQG